MLFMDSDPNKSKAICISWLKKRRKLPDIFLTDNHLPWVYSIKHIGNIIINSRFILEEDMEQKRACYINKNCEINQELVRADPEMITKINYIYNSSWFGSMLWDCYSPTFSRIE